MVRSSLHIDGLDRLNVSFITLSMLTDDDVWGIIEPAAIMLRDKMQAVILRLFRQRTGSLYDSITIERLREREARGGAIYARIGPNQKPHAKSTTGKRKPRAQGGGGGHYDGTNAEVGWILEYGSVRIPAKHWMETACDEAEGYLYQLMAERFDRTLEAAGL